MLRTVLEEIGQIQSDMRKAAQACDGEITGLMNAIDRYTIEIRTLRMSLEQSN